MPGEHFTVSVFVVCGHNYVASIPSKIRLRVQVKGPWSPKLTYTFYPFF